MSNIRRILVGLGDMGHSKTATAIAVDIASSIGASLTGISVVDLEGIGSTGPVPIGAGHEAKELREFRQKEAHVLIDSVNAHFKECCSEKQVDNSIYSAESKPFKCLAEQARYHDLTICGAGHLLQPNKDGEAPVQLVQLIEHGVHPLILVTEDHRPIKRVLLPYSGSMESAKAMKSFARCKLWPGATVRILTCKDSHGDPEQLRQDAVEYCRCQGYEVDSAHHPEHPKHAILPYAQEWEADLIVMGNSRRNLLLRRIFGETMLHTVANTDRTLFLAQ